MRGRRGAGRRSESQRGALSRPRRLSGRALGIGWMWCRGADRRSSLTCAAWSPCGSRIYAGTSAGVVLVIDPVSRLVQSRIRVGTSGIKQLAFDAAGR